jgi:putative tricarboxylic transport membrane protein
MGTVDGAPRAECVNASARGKIKASAVAAAFFLLSTWICVEALQVPLGSFRMPGAGFFPLFLGLTLGILSVMLLAQSLVSPAGGSTRVWPEQPEVLYLVGSLVAAVWLFERAGFLIAMALFLGVAMRVLGTKSWSTVVVGALVGSVASYVVFSRTLQIALPSGIVPF